MPNHLSALGIIHTAISIIALLVAYYALYRSGKIDPTSGSGKSYIILTILTCVTGFPIMKTGHLTPGHYVAIIILILLPIGIYANRFFGKAGKYVQVVAMSTTLFLSMVPAIVETLTRLPISHPIAAGPDDPILKNSLTVLFVLYLFGVIYQVVKIKKRGKKAPPQVNPSGV
ncbi:hypothetical protein [Mucilaginibacter sp.]|jgi:hypothetical protein|uniref:hypothetical protein n=1 Tax=Mucilaginibacter sp. TaxID=1882438 RepID=UPI002CB82E6B|nr:hypothetical protein [Mucilaginibacter sp.]HTI57765.1 hypothetical protein [Mucilaginibacter sp.]